MTAPALLACRNLTVYREEKLALDGLTLDIRTGEHVAIFGPNGCGKSTLIKTITRECYPRLGDENWSLTLLGRSTWNVFELRALMGIVTNDLVTACTTNYPAREIVLSGFFSSIGIWPNHEVTRAMERKAEEMLALLEVTHLADRRVEEMSSGEARRVVIARALVNDPQALILDEPSTSLDLRATHELRDAMSAVARAGKTIILVTHHLPDVIPEIERVILMRDGKVWRDGAKPDMLTEAHLGELFGLRVAVSEREGMYSAW